MPCCLLAALLAATPPLIATRGPRGEVAELRLGPTVYLTDMAVAVAKPGWAGSLVDQRAADPAGVKVERRGATTVHTLIVAGEGARVRLKVTATASPASLAVRWEVTPEQEIDAEKVAVQGTVPAALHAGRTRWLLADAGVRDGLLPAEQDPASHIVFGGCAPDWAALLGPDGSALRITAENCLVQLQDNRKWQVPGFGLLFLADGGRLLAGKTIRFGATFTADTSDQVQAEAREVQRYELAGLPQTDHRPLRLAAVRAERQGVAVNGLFELHCAVEASYDNPFDPEQIAVDAEVTRPDGGRATVPGFYYAPLRIEPRQGAERLRLAGPPEFRVRYAPTLVGPHQVVVQVTDRSGTVRSAPLRFTATTRHEPRFVRVAKDSPLHFALDDGRPFFAVGENMAWATGRMPVADYAAWLKGLGAAGGNWARLFLSNWEKGLEWMPAPTPRPGTGTYQGLGRYALDNAWRLDEVVGQARLNGVRLLFCLGTHGEFYSGGYFNEGCWISNPYNAANGGPCATAEEFWTSARARRVYQQRLRYVIARWGWSPNVFGWEFWNEVPPTPEREAWLAEMAAWLKAHDPNRHLVSTTYGNPAVWRCPDIDFSMQHLYGQAGNVADFTPTIQRQVRAHLAAGKPYVPAEFGIDWQTGDNRWDPKGTGINLHNGAWAAVMSGAAGTTMLWYWDGYVHPLNLYPVLTPVRKFVDTVDWAHTRFTPIPGIEANLPADIPETFTDVTIPGDIEWGSSPSSDYTVGRDGGLRGGPVAMTLGSPQRGNPGELLSRVTWHLDLPATGKVIARLGQVSRAARLQVAVDGRVVLDRELTTGEPGKGPWKTSKFLEQYKLWLADYDEDLTMEVPAGPHEVSFANVDGDWLQIRSLTLPAYRSSRYPDVNLLGLGSDRLLLLWVHNRESTWRTEYDGKQPHEVRGLTVSLPAATGAWTVAWWDTFTGRVLRREVAKVADGRLTLAVPGFARDLAARLARAAGG
ncbi:MAG: DUF5060 domain-containing protein [Armatimonadetes bacterium]|nr:DUF5060 domain-containing protein [Armatimonadota bacterium]